MSPRISRMALAVSAGSLLAGAPLLAACGPSSSGPSYSQWAATDGAAGRINLDEVQVAFQESSSATEFESRVNEIYEGDGIILIRSRQDGDRLTLEGWEDLDGNSIIDDAADDQLFAIIKEDDQHQLQGYHANSYYNSRFGGRRFPLYLPDFQQHGPGRLLLPDGSRPGNNHSAGTRYVPGLQSLRLPTGSQPAVHVPAADLFRFPLPGGRAGRELGSADLSADPEVVRRLPQQQHADAQQQPRRRYQINHIPQLQLRRRRRLQRRRRSRSLPQPSGGGRQDTSSLAGLSRWAPATPRALPCRHGRTGCRRTTALQVNLPAEDRLLTLRQLLCRLFPPDAAGQAQAAARLDWRTNPDLPACYAALLTLAEQWRAGFCRLSLATGRGWGRPGPPRRLGGGALAATAFVPAGRWPWRR